MKVAWEADQRRKEQESSLKRQRASEDVAAAGFQAGFEGKRRRLEDGSRATPPIQQYTGNMAIFAGASGTYPPAGIADFDVTSLPINIVIECIIANLQVIGEEAMSAAIEVGCAAVWLSLIELSSFSDIAKADGGYRPRGWHCTGAKRA